MCSITINLVDKCQVKGGHHGRNNKDISDQGFADCNVDPGHTRRPTTIQGCI